MKKPTAMKKVEVSLPQFVIVKSPKEIGKLNNILNSCEPDAKPKVVVEYFGKDTFLKVMFAMIRHVNQKPDDKYIKRMKKKYCITT